MNREIEALINELESLQLETSQLLRREEDVLRRLREVVSNEDQTEPIVAVVVPSSPPSYQPISSPRDLQPGDRVRITNSISSIVRGRASTEADRNSTVRLVTATRRVLITTDSGVRTWRYCSNLSRLPSSS